MSFLFVAVDSVFAFTNNTQGEICLTFSVNGNDEIVLKDKQRQNDDDSTHFILRGTMNSFYHLIHDFDNQNNKHYRTELPSLHEEDCYSHHKSLHKDW